MFESKPQAIGICLKTTAGTYPLYREFGGNVVDEANPPMRRIIVEQLAAYYPDVRATSVTVSMESTSGQYTYEISTRE